MVEVTQADRDRAAAYWHISRIGNVEMQRRYLSGEADEAFIVQAFATHRTEAVAAMREENDRLRRELAQANGQTSVL